MSRAGEEYGRFFDKDGKPKANAPAVVVDVVAAIEKARQASKRSTIRARYSSVCVACREPIKPGEYIAWGKAGGATHAACWAGEWREKAG